MWLKGLSHERGEKFLWWVFKNTYMKKFHRENVIAFFFLMATFASRATRIMHSLLKYFSKAWECLKIYFVVHCEHTMYISVIKFVIYILLRWNKERCIICLVLIWWSIFCLFEQPISFYEQLQVYVVYSKRYQHLPSRAGWSPYRFFSQRSWTIVV